jgi:hypothetical protein
VQFPIAYLNKMVVGPSYRVVGVFLHDTDHVDSSSHFAYFRITR